MVVYDTTRFRDSGRPAGFERVLVRVFPLLWEELGYRAASEPFVLEKRKLLEVVKAVHIFKRIEVIGLGLFQPEWGSEFWVKVQLHNLDCLFIQFLAGISNKSVEVLAHDGRPFVQFPAMWDSGSSSLNGSGDQAETPDETNAFLVQA